jgi:hypothetical protein
MCRVIIIRSTCTLDPVLWVFPALMCGHDDLGMMLVGAWSVRLRHLKRVPPYPSLLKGSSILPARSTAEPIVNGVLPVYHSYKQEYF